MRRRCRELSPWVAFAAAVAMSATLGCSSHGLSSSGGGGGSVDASAAGSGGGSSGGGGAGGGGSAGGGAGGGSGGGSSAAGGGGGSGPLASCKRGAGYTDENALDLPLFKKGIGWWYDWGNDPDPTVTAALQAGGVEFVPMVWTGPPYAPLDVNAVIKSIPPGAHFLLGFNEPNFGQQANLTPAQAAAAWPLLEQIAKARNLKLVSPALNYCGGNCNETDPFVWMDMFFAACTNCQIDYVAFHWYSCSAGALTSMLSKFEAYGKPVWLTEFSCLDSNFDETAAGQLAYMKTAIPILEADSKVFRYSWFMGRSTKPAAYDLFGDPGKLTALGQSYVSFPGACTF